LSKVISLIESKDYLFCILQNRIGQLGFPLLKLLAQTNQPEPSTNTNRTTRTQYTPYTRTMPSSASTGPSFFIAPSLMQVLDTTSNDNTDHVVCVVPKLRGLKLLALNPNPVKRLPIG
jgi:hypothetical protein